jgi:hypothetical protein
MMLHVEALLGLLLLPLAEGRGTHGGVALEVQQAALEGVLDFCRQPRFVRDAYLNLDCRWVGAVGVQGRHLAGARGRRMWGWGLRSRSVAAAVRHLSGMPPHACLHATVACPASSSACGSIPVAPSCARDALSSTSCPARPSLPTQLPQHRAQQPV